MRFERWRGMPLVLAMAAVGLGLAWVELEPGRMDIASITRSPGKSPAYDFTTGGEFMAPPVPYGHYAKDHLLGLRELPAARAAGLHRVRARLARPWHRLRCCGGHGCGLCSGSGSSGTAGGGTPAAASPVAAAAWAIITRRAGSRRATRVRSSSAVVRRIGPVGRRDQPVVAGRHGRRPTVGPVALRAGRLRRARTVIPPRLKGHGASAGSARPGLRRLRRRRDARRLRRSRLRALPRQGQGLRILRRQGLLALPLRLGLHGKLAGLLHHRPKVEYFVGAGGPVPITPGYVPYIVATRSPRDFFAFPPMNPYDP